MVSAKADNLIVRTDAYAKDPEQTALLAAYEALVKPPGGRPVGSITATLSRDEGPAGESVLGQIIADAQLAATRSEQDGGAVIAFTNTGGIRTSLPRSADGVVTFADIFAVQPFGNSLVTLTLTGAQIKTLLEQQWLNQPKPRILQVSNGFSYTWDDRRPRGDFVAAEGITLQRTPDRSCGPLPRDGERVSGRRRRRVRRLEGGQPSLAVGPSEVAALEAYFKANSPLAPGTLDRIRKAY